MEDSSAGPVAEARRRSSATSEPTGAMEWAGWFPARAVLASALTIGVIGMSVAYALWIKRGCVPTPFISDLALRAPESQVFGATVCCTLPLVGLTLSTQNAAQFAALRKSGKSVVVWLVSVAAGASAIVGAGMAGLTAWDNEFNVHMTGALIFFTMSFVFIVGAMGVWSQLEFPVEGPILVTRVVAYIGVLAAVVGIGLFSVYGPPRPCGTDEDPVRDNVNCIAFNERESFFTNFCEGNTSVHSFAAGNVACVLEWVVFASIMVCCACIVVQGAAEREQAHDARALLAAEAEGSNYSKL